MATAGLRGLTKTLIGLPFLLSMYTPAVSAQDGPVTALTSADGTRQYFTQRLRPQLRPSDSPGLGALNACDLNADGVVNATDVQLAVNQALNLSPCTDADLQVSNVCNVLDVQVVAAAVQTGTCNVPNCVPTTTYPNTSTSPSSPPACPPPLPPNPNPPSTSQDYGPIHPCMYVSGGVRYQAIEVTGVSGEQTLNANLFSGTTCNAGNLIDVVFGGGQFPFFGSSIYWLIHFWDEPNTSAVWTVGSTITGCIDYSKVADCN